ncbi:hypothetical protein IIZ77_02700 [Candidatus Saccharibacteria bacterium]|nr:hypothetical protein [Candidatus Saccharibacteria bacterium]
MVYQPAQPSKIEKKHKRSKVMQLILDVLTLVLVAGATYAIFRLTSVKPENQEKNNPEVMNKVTVDEEDEDPMWLNRTVNSWIGSFSSDFSASVEVYDLDKDAVVGEFMPESVYTGHAASELAADFNMGFATAGQTSARELTEILKAVFRHAGMSDEDWATYMGRWLAQTEIYSAERCDGYCKVRDGLPAGFTSENMKVYNENFMDTNRSYFEVYRDAAIVEFKAGEKTRSFAVALVAKTFPQQTEFKNLGTALEKVISAHIKNEV